MYTVAVRRDFIAQHYLLGGDWGEENQPHSHHYQVELQLHGDILDQHGYLVDIVEIETSLDSLLVRFRDKNLNSQPEFTGLNPSIEHFSRVLCLALAEKIQSENILALTLKLWENQIAWASYHLDFAH